MVDNGTRNKHTFISSKLSLEAKVDIFICHEKVGVQESNILQHTAAIGCRSSTRAEDPARLGPRWTVLLVAAKVHSKSGSGYSESTVIDTVALVEIKHLTGKASGLRKLAARLG